MVKREKDWYGIDEEMVMFKTNTTARLPVISGIDEKKVVSGKVKDNHHLVMAVRLVNQFLDVSLPLSGQILKIDLSNPECVILESKDYGRIRLGAIEFDEIRKKLKRLVCVLENINEKVIDIEYVDLRFRNIVIKPIRHR